MVSFKVPWTAISSLLGQFSKEFHRPAVLLQLNLAYFLPSMPALLLQSVVQERLEQRIGTPQAALLRYWLGLGSLAVLGLLLPLAATQPAALLALTAGVGVAYSIAFGTSYQLAARFTPACTQALTTGFVSCGVVVLLADLGLKSGPYYTAPQLARLGQLVAAQCLLGLLAACLLLRLHWSKLAAAGKRELVTLHVTSKLSRGNSLGSGSLGARGSVGGGLLHHQEPRYATGSSSSSMRWRQDAAGSSSAPGGDGWMYSRGSAGGSSNLRQAAGVHSTARPGQQPAAYAEMVDVEEAGSSSKQPSHGGHSSSSSSQHEHKVHGRPSWLRPQWQLRSRLKASCQEVWVLLPVLRAILPAATALLLSVGSSMLAFPFFTFVPLTGQFGERLSEVLFYARLAGDIAGRVLPSRCLVQSKAGVLCWGAAKAALLLVLVPALLKPRLVGGDAGLAVLVAGYWWLSGYVNVSAYLVAPQCVAVTARGRAGSLMAFCFQCSCFVGLLAAWLLQESGLVHRAATS